MRFNFANFVILDALTKLKLAHIFGSIIFYVSPVVHRIIKNHKYILLRTESCDSQIFFSQ